MNDASSVTDDNADSITELPKHESTETEEDLPPEVDFFNFEFGAKLLLGWSNFSQLEELCELFVSEN